PAFDGTQVGIWATDGTVAGTRRLMSLPTFANFDGKFNTADPSFDVQQFVPVNGTIFLRGPQLPSFGYPTPGAGQDPFQRSELWAFLASCGNGQLNPGEECDDGNNVSGDGCSADCKIEFRFLATPVPAGGSVTTDITDTGPIAAHPVIATVTTPVAGTVSIQEGPEASLPSGYTAEGITEIISAPSAPALNPLRLVFPLDAS